MGKNCFSLGIWGKKDHDGDNLCARCHCSPSQCPASWARGPGMAGKAFSSCRQQMGLGHVAYHGLSGAYGPSLCVPLLGVRALKAVIGRLAEP